MSAWLPRKGLQEKLVNTAQRSHTIKEPGNNVRRLDEPRLTPPDEVIHPAPSQAVPPLTTEGWRRMMQFFKKPTFCHYRT